MEVIFQSPAQESADYSRRKPWDKLSHFAGSAGRWLRQSGSLTAAMRAVCGELTVEVLDNDWATPTDPKLDPAPVLDERYWLRAVKISGDDAPFIYARTWIPESSLVGALSAVPKLGTRPLGELLYQNTDLVRQEMAFFAARWPQLVDDVGHGLRVGRRGKYLLDGAPLWISEILLPGLLRKETP